MGEEKFRISYTVEEMMTQEEIYLAAGICDERRHCPPWLWARDAACTGWIIANSPSPDPHTAPVGTVYGLTSDDPRAPTEVLVKISPDTWWTSALDTHYSDDQVNGILIIHRGPTKVIIDPSHLELP